MDTQLTRRRFLRTAGLGAAGAVLAACAPKATPTPMVVKETVVVAGTPKVVEKTITATPAPKQAVKVVQTNMDPIDLQDGYNKMAEAFNKKFAGKIQMEVKNVPGDGWTQKLLAMVASNDGPDLWMDFPQPVDYPKRGFVQNITPYIQRDGIKREELWFESGWKPDLYMGNQYASPRSVHPSAFAYNKDLLDSVGVKYPTNDWTTDDFVNLHVKTRSKEKGTFGSAIQGHGAVLWGSGGMPYGMGLEITNNDGRKCQGYLDSQNAIEVIQFYLDLQVKYDAVATGDQQKAMGPDPFASGKLALGGAAETLPEDVKFKWGLVYHPKYKNFKQHTWNDPAVWFMWSGATRKDEIWEMLKFSTGVEGTKIMMTSKTNFPSPCPQVWKDLGYDKPGQAGTIGEIRHFLYKTLTELPSQKNWMFKSSYFWKCIGPNFQGIWTQYVQENKRDLAALVKDAAAKSQKCLDEQFALEG